MMRNQTLRRVTAEQIASPDVTFTFPDVSEIVERVRTFGDRALAEIAVEVGDRPPRKIDSREFESAYAGLDETVRIALEDAAQRIEVFARAQRAALSDVNITIGGCEMGQRIVPIERAGIYVPGGSYALPSSLLMCAIPARVAGVSRVTVCTPRAAPETLAAARIAGVDEVFELGGAQAIAAMAFGTANVPRVDIIVGPGNRYVTAAKRFVYGSCGIDSLAGPSEILIIASADADPELTAADLLAQAEHDTNARAMLLTDCEAFADSVDAALDRQLATLKTARIARKALNANGWCAVLPLENAAVLANRIAPEHLELHGARAEALADSLRAYGALFIGSQAAEAFGDYGSGPNHVLPTDGSARFSSGLSVLTFLTIRTFQRINGTIDAASITRTATLAAIEGLHAHHRSALYRTLSS